jgi:hypothetical protein
MAAQGARRPAGRVTESFNDSAGRQGAYGLLESDAVGTAEVAGAMFASSARRSRGQPFVYCAVDGTSLTLTDRARQKGFGSIGSRAAKGRGLKVMNAMLLSPQGVPLGMTAQQWWVRGDRRRKHRDQLSAHEKETQHWLDAMVGTRAVMAAHAPDTVCWFQLDREGDAWPVLMDAGLGKHWFTVRACRDRRVILENGERGYLRDVLAQQPVIRQYPLAIRGAPKRSARTANLAVRACKVVLDLRDKKTKKRFPLEINVVQVVEQGTTPPGEKPIKWTLLTNRKIECGQDLQDVIAGYSMRWCIEEFHRTWKSGGCRVEETQLRSPEAVIKWATILTAVAVRIERIKKLSREEPQRPAADEYSPLEIRAAALLRFGTAGKARIVANPSISDVTTWIAEIGGYTGPKSSGGPPGAIVIARGLKDVRAAAKALAAAEGLL